MNIKLTTFCLLITLIFFSNASTAQSDENTSDVSWDETVKWINEKFQSEYRIFMTMEKRL